MAPKRSQHSSKQKKNKGFGSKKRSQRASASPAKPAKTAAKPAAKAESIVVAKPKRERVDRAPQPIDPTSSLLQPPKRRGKAEVSDELADDGSASRPEPTPAASPGKSRKASKAGEPASKPGKSSKGKSNSERKNGESASSGTKGAAKGKPGRSAVAASAFSSTGGLYAASAFASDETAAVPLFIVHVEDYQGWLDSAPENVQAWLRGSGFRPGAGKSCLLPGDEGPSAALVTVEDPACLWEYAELPRLLSVGVYDAEPELEARVAQALCLGWALGCYRFERYKQEAKNRPLLLWPSSADRSRVLCIAEAIYFARDLITTPASDMGPEELAAEVARLAQLHGATVESTVGEDLLRENYPMIHAVGRASSRAPRLIDMRWGKRKHPRVTLVGKGVCFDTGGLDLKPSQFMLLMKKDMGGAALVLGLAHAIMSLKLPVCLRLLIPAVENSVSGNAMRPLDVLSSRKGVTVEVGDTDAEGRLVLADALTEALREEPDLLIDAATLTGAARVALGASMPAVFANRDATWRALESASEREQDALWRLPLHQAYRKKLDSQVADLSSTGDNLGGAITAALFLREFATSESDWVHVDTMGFNTETQPGRPRGGEALGLRALLSMIEARYSAESTSQE